MLNNKVIVITGGAGRIGSAFAKAIVQNNGIAIIADTNRDTADAAIERIQECFEFSVKSKLIYKEIDIVEFNSIFELIKIIKNDFGRIDALVNNAYPRNENYGKKFFEITHDDFSDFLMLHLGGYFNVSQQFLKFFLDQGYGNIINISSIQGVAAPAFETYEGTNMHSPIEYTVAKHGLIGMTKYMAKMFKKNAIRVNAISPGGILAGQPERFLEQYKNRCGTKGMLESNDIAGALIYLLSDSSKYITGQNIIIDDGFGL